MISKQMSGVAPDCSFKAIKLKYAENAQGAMALFKYSIVHLTILFIALFLDKALM